MGLISNATTIFDAGSMSAGLGGSMVFIKKLTASSSSSLSFVNGASSVVLDNTYKEYVFIFKDIHPSDDAVEFRFNLSADSGSNYNVAKTTTFFRATHLEGDSTAFAYRTGNDLAQSTAFQMILDGVGNDNDSSASGTFTLHDPSSTTFVKHFISRSSTHQYESGVRDCFMTGYGNTTSAVNAVRFDMSAGTIDAGDICLYGIA